MLKGKNKTEEKKKGTNKITSLEALIKILESEGVKYVFGVPGGHTLPLLDGINNSDKIQFILVKHEEGAAFMADGYARVSRSPGICSSTVGPGATNLITGLCGAYLENVPVISLTGQIPTKSFGKTAHQEITGVGRTPNQIELLRIVTKASLFPARATKLPEAARHAFRIALNPTFGPVNISIPSDIYYDYIEYEDIDPKKYRTRRTENFDISKINSAVQLIKDSKYPVLFAGSKTLFPDVTKQIEDLATQYNIPVVTSLNSKGAFSDYHDMALGCIELFGHRTAEKYLKEKADLLITVGEAFEEWTSLAWDPAIIAKKKIIQIDNDPIEIGRHYQVDLGIDGNLGSILSSLLDVLKKDKIPSKDLKNYMLDLKESLDFYNEKEMYDEKSIPLKPQRLLNELRNALPDDTIVFADSGHTVRWAGRYFKSRSRHFFTSLMFEPMGYAVAASIGAKLAAPKQPVVCICGDGAFQMNGMEVMTAVNYNIPVIWVIFNDGRLNMIHSSQTIYYPNRCEGSEFKAPNFKKLAESFGVLGYEVTKPNQIQDCIKEALDKNVPTIIDAKIDPNEIPPLKPRGLAVAKEMGLTSPSKDSPTAAKAFIKMMKEK